MHSYIVLGAFFLVSLLIRLWLLDKRWLDVDEGAHLMDATLALDGWIPVVDYMSREPLYVYTFAGFVKLFGTNFVIARFLPAACSLLVGFVVFFLAKSLFDIKVGVLAAALYWILPLELFQSVKVTTEPLVMLLTSLAFCAVMRFALDNRRGWLLLAGVLSALAFYTRNSALILPLAVFLFLLCFYKGRVAELAKSLSLFSAGYFGIIILAIVGYSRFAELTEVLFNLQLNPVSFLPWGIAQLSSAERAGSDAPFWPADLFRKYILQTLYMHSFLLLALAFAVCRFIAQAISANRTELSTTLTARSLVYWWVLVLFLAYAFYSYVAGFIIDYSREFFPPLTIILAAWICSAVPALNRNRVLEWSIIAIACLLAGLFVLHGYNKTWLRYGHHAALTVTLLTLFAFAGKFRLFARRLAFCLTIGGFAVFVAVSERVPHLFPSIPSLIVIAIVYLTAWIFLRGNDQLPLRRYVDFVCVSLVLASLAVNVSYSGTLLNPTYNAEWSPEAVKKIASYIRAETESTDEIISGAVIWEFHAARLPFQLVAHPFELEFAAPARKEEIARVAAVRPPKVIILDGWTERLYLRHIPSLTELIAERYQLVPIVAGPAAFDVKVYRLRGTPGRRASPM